MQIPKNKTIGVSMNKGVIRSISSDGITPFELICLNIADHSLFKGLPLNVYSLTTQCL